MGNGSKITTTNRDMSIAILNSKMILIDTGTIINGITPDEEGQLAIPIDSTASKLANNMYMANQSKTGWVHAFRSIIGLVKWGRVVPTTSTLADNFEGVLKGGTLQGTFTGYVAITTTRPARAKWTSGAVSGNPAGYSVGRAVALGQDSCYFIGTIATDGTTVRVYFGFHSSVGALLADSDDPLNALSGFVLGKITTSANWQILRNDGGGVTVAVDTGVLVVANTEVTIEIFSDPANARWGWSINQGAVTFYTTDIPLSTALLDWATMVRTNSAAARLNETSHAVVMSQR